MRHIAFHTRRHLTKPCHTHSDDDIASHTQARMCEIEAGGRGGEANHTQAVLQSPARASHALNAASAALLIRYNIANP